MIALPYLPVGPALEAFRLHFVNLMRALQPHVVDVATSCYTVGLIPSYIHQTITSSPAMPSSDKVSRLLSGIQKSITSDSRSLEWFVTVLRQSGCYLELMGNHLDSTYCEFLYCSD